MFHGSHNTVTNLPFPAEKTGAKAMISMQASKIYIFLQKCQKSVFPYLALTNHQSASKILLI
jgi:hypothetical protein